MLALPESTVTWPDQSTKLRPPSSRPLSFTSAPAPPGDHFERRWAAGAADAPFPCWQMGAAQEGRGGSSEEVERESGRGEEQSAPPRRGPTSRSDAMGIQIRPEMLRFRTKPLTPGYCRSHLGEPQTRQDEIYRSAE